MSIAKKIFIISTTLLVMVLFFWGIYQFAFNDDAGEVAKNEIEKTPIKDDNKPADGSGTVIAAEKIYPITEEAVLAPFLKERTETIAYYSHSDGTASEISLEGKNKRFLSSEKLENLKNVFWSPDGNKVISYFNNGQPVFFLYDYQTKSGKQIKSGVDNINWTNLGDKIIYKYYDEATKERSLNIADPDGTNWTKLDDLNYKNMKIEAIPATSLISFWNYPNAFEETQMKTIPLVGGESKVIFTEKFGVDYLWSPTGEKALISFSNEKGGGEMELGIINNQGGEFKNLSIPTLVSKAVWAKNNNTIYYALPGGIPEGSVMPNDYQEEKFTTQDTFWSVDTTTGKKARAVELDKMKGIYDASDLFLSPENDALFFLNKIDKKIYRINL